MLLLPRENNHYVSESGGLKVENFDKYNHQSKRDTNFLIDEPAIVFLGRTMPEIISSAVVFLIFVNFDYLYTALIAAFLIGYAVPLYRIKFSRGFAPHLLWSIGLNRPEEVFPIPIVSRVFLISIINKIRQKRRVGLQVFSCQRSLKIFGP